MPLFSVIAAYYQGSVPDDIFRRGIGSVHAQTFTDYELICVHDGPLLHPITSPPCKIVETETRANDVGHTPHDFGMRSASGDYIVHFNVDNLLYPNALEEIAKEIRRPARYPETPDVHRLDENNIIIFPIKMYGLNRVFGRYTAQVRSDEFYEILTGNPPARLNIDTMQLVMRRDLWIAEGGWHDKSFDSDGKMYPEFCKKYGYRIVGPILGEHH
jgi:hypothetical protein